MSKNMKKKGRDCIDVILIGVRINAFESGVNVEVEFNEVELGVKRVICGS